MENKDRFLEQKKAIEEQKTYQEQYARKKAANKLCTISSILHVVGIITFILAISLAGNNKEFYELFKYPLALVPYTTYIASWVLMIIARVRFKESVFAKILMWVYIGLVTLAILAIIAFIAWCMASCSGMPG
ncbi:MAG: hypothetical protein K5643_00830 [Saccharofermentans sp.]|nr:hypothetical protein [Saccharofermentans sp.]